MKISTLTSASLIATLASCTTHVPASPIPERFPETPPKSTPEAVAKPRNTGWSFGPHRTTNTYRSTTQTVIAQVDNSSTRRDSTQTTTEFTLDVDYLPTSTNISGQITSVATNTSSVLRLPLAFSATISLGHFRLDPTPPQLHDELCTTDVNQRLGEIRTAVYSLPMQVNSDSSWADSTSTSTCSGKGLPTTLEIIRSYKVVGESQYAGQPALLLNREDQIRLTGEGTQQQHQLQIQGNGTAVSRITIDPRTGALTAIETTQQLQLMIAASGQSRKFTQTTRQQIRLLR